MAKYTKYWLTPNSQAKIEALRTEGEDSLRFKAFQELEANEEPFKSPAWEAYCTSDAEAKDIIAAASKVRERFGSSWKLSGDVDRMLKLASKDDECQAIFRQLNLSEHDMSFVRDALLTHAGEK